MLKILKQECLYNGGLTFELTYTLSTTQAFVKKACDHTRKPATSRVCNISHPLIVWEWQVIHFSPLAVFANVQHLISSEMAVMYCLLG